MNKTASGDLVPSQFNFAQVEKHLKGKRVKDKERKISFQRAKNTSKQDFCKQEERERKDD